MAVTNLNHLTGRDPPGAQSGAQSRVDGLESRFCGVEGPIRTLRTPLVVLGELTVPAAPTPARRLRA